MAAVAILVAFLIVFCIATLLGAGVVFALSLFGLIAFSWKLAFGAGVGAICLRALFAGK